MAYPFVRLLLLVGFTETPHSFGDTRFWMHFRIWQTMLPLTALLRLTKLFSPSRTRAIIARVRHLLCHARLISVVILHISEACPKKRYVFLVQLKTGKAKKGIYNIQHINSYHSQLKRFMRGFNGVSTKYLNNYLVWNNLVNYAKESDMEKRNIFLTFVLATLKTAKCRDLSNRPAVPLVA